MKAFPLHKFDTALVPLRPAVDTVFLIRAVEHPEQDNGVCRALFHYLMQISATVIVPAHVLAEFEIRSQDRLPRTPRIIVGAFDESAARVMTSFGHTAMRDFKDKGYNKHVIRNDAYVAATAARHHADALITADEQPDMGEVCALAGVKLIHPGSLVLLPAQLDLVELAELSAAGRLSAEKPAPEAE